MKTENLNLDEMKCALERALIEYQHGLFYNKLQFQVFPDFQLTPEKPNSARTVVPVKYADNKVGDLYVIAFLPEDGTGDNKTYNIDDLIIPQELQFEEKPERVIPRAKTGIICEGCFPLFSMNNHRASMYAVSLDELTLGKDSKTVESRLKLGLDEEVFSLAIDSFLGIVPKVYFTTGTDKDGKRFGDPHAVYSGIKKQDAVQVAGFLGVKDEDNPILEFTKDWVMPKGYQSV